MVVFSVTLRWFWYHFIRFDETVYWSLMISRPMFLLWAWSLKKKKQFGNARLDLVTVSFPAQCDERTKFAMDFHEFSWNGFIIDVVFFIFMGPDNSKSPPWPSCVCVLGFFLSRPKSPLVAWIFARSFFYVFFFMDFFYGFFFIKFRPPPGSTLADPHGGARKSAASSHGMALPFFFFLKTSICQWMPFFISRK